MIVFSPVLNDLKILFFRDTLYMCKGIHRRVAFGATCSRASFALFEIQRKQQGWK